MYFLPFYSLRMVCRSYPPQLLYCLPQKRITALSDQKRLIHSISIRANRLLSALVFSKNSFGLRVLASAESVLYSVLDLSSLSVIESVKSAYQITCDPSDPLEADALSDLAVYILNYFVVHCSLPPFCPPLHYRQRRGGCEVKIMYIVVFYGALPHHIVDKPVENYVDKPFSAVSLRFQAALSLHASELPPGQSV